MEEPAVHGTWHKQLVCCPCAFSRLQNKSNKYQDLEAPRIGVDDWELSSLRTRAWHACWALLHFPTILGNYRLDHLLNHVNILYIYIFRGKISDV